MDAVFVRILQLSLSASLLVVVILILRLLLRRAPRRLICLLWALAALRLICPLSIENPLSLMPDTLASGYLVTRWADAHTTPTADTTVSASTGEVDTSAPDVPAPSPAPVPTPAHAGIDAVTVLSLVWLAGTLTMLVYAVVSYRLLCRRIADAVTIALGVRRSHRVDSPFVLGMTSLVIVIPENVDPADLEYILAHERAHIRHGDHWWKPLGFALLSVYWFNPLFWLAYALFCCDLEAACDEKVITSLAPDARRAYSTALLNASISPHRRTIPSPLAFGEVGVRERILRVMRYRRPTPALVIAAVAAIILTAVCLLTVPARDPNLPQEADFTGWVAVTRHSDGKLTGFDLLTDDDRTVHIVLTDETACFSFLDEVTADDFLSCSAPPVCIAVDTSWWRTLQRGADGILIPTYQAHQFLITEYRTPDTASLSDGTQLEVCRSAHATIYTLTDGTELLRVQDPQGPERFYSSGVASLNDLSASARARILDHYRALPFPLELQPLLDAAHDKYLRTGVELGSEENWYMQVSLEHDPSASNERLLWIQSTCRTPFTFADDRHERTCTAFDRETGEPLDPWALFTCSPEEAIRTILDAAGIGDADLRAEIEATFDPRRLIFFQDNAELFFPEGILPSDPFLHGLSLDYTGALGDILQPWALPTPSATDEIVVSG